MRREGEGGRRREREEREGGEREGGERRKGGEGGKELAHLSHN